jgi:hypothetical protein
MNDRQEAKLNMFQIVLEVCRKNEPVYSGIPAFGNGVKQLDDSIFAIKQTAGQQSGKIVYGVSTEKSAAVDILAQEGVKVANAIYVYALTTGNKLLIPKVSVNKSMFYAGHYNDVLILAKNIATEAHIYAAALPDYGIDDAAINALDNAIGAFEQVINKPQVAIDERKLYTGNLKQLFAETDSILYDHLDKLITLFKISEPDFFALYKTARNVIDTAKRSSAKKEK